MERYKITKYACYMTNISMSAVANLSPLLFITFKEEYGLSYTQLGLLVLVNFCTQLGIDLIFSFFSQHFRMSATVRLTPAITVIGLCVYAFLPLLLPGAVFFSLVVGSIIFSASAGLAEVLISPVIAAMPSENPEREMSRLHSVYAWGVVLVVLISTLFLAVFGKQSWPWLALLWASVPLTAFLLFMKAEIPPLETPEKASHVMGLLRSGEMILCFMLIFFGGASECTMAQWSSGYLEKALGIPKIYGDIFGVAMFAVMLGLGRTLYAKKGSHIYRVLMLGSLGAVLCYMTAALSGNSTVGLAACAMTGLCTSMLWPGSLVVAVEKIPKAGVAVFALMAAGGDLGASVAPQLTGVFTDMAAASPTFFSFLSGGASMTPEQTAMRFGLFTAGIYPLLAFLTVFLLRPRKQKNNTL